MERRDPLAAAGGMIMLIGIVILLVWDAVAFWPWLLAVIGLSSLPVGVVRGGIPAGLLPAAWLIGLAALFAAGLFWPGILVLSGMSALLIAIAPPDKLDQRHQRLMAERRLGRQMLQKRKRGLAVPPDTDRLVLRDDHDFPGNGWDHTDDIWDSEYEEDETGRLSHDSQD